MSELIAKVSEILGIPETLVQRSAEARAEGGGGRVLRKEADALERDDREELDRDAAGVGCVKNVCC